MLSDFNPRPREEGDKYQLPAQLRGAGISIHALVKRATRQFRLARHRASISIHALVKRATFLWYWGLRKDKNFNPRPREEGDKSGTEKFSRGLYFNPRPREEGDSFLTLSLLFTWYFNPRPREEGDPGEREFIMVSTKFQSTPSWRGRHSISLTMFWLCHFNPRPREEGDMATQQAIGKPRLISIHALVKRATIWHFAIQALVIFQSTPSWRGRPLYIEPSNLVDIISIHALVKRATYAILMTASVAIYFNPRPREEGDCFFRYLCWWNVSFQSTPSWRGRPFVPFQ